MDRWVKTGLLGALLLAAGLVQAAEPVALALPDLDGEIHDIAQHRGKWVVVNYWATWCPPCIHEIPELVAFHARHADRDAVVIGVNNERLDGELLRQFVAEFEINYPVLRDDPQQPSPLGRVFGLPTTYLVAPDGSLAVRHNGPVTAAQLERMIGDQVPVAATGSRTQ